MLNKIFKSLFALTLVMGAALGFVACEDKHEEVTNPTVEVSVKSLSFSNEEETQSVSVTANGDWKVTVDYVTGEDWIVVTPQAGNGNAAISVSVPRNDSGAIREATIKVIALHPVYGNWDVKKIKVAQSSDEKPVAEETLLYSDNFDGKQAEKGEYWPYVKDFPEFANAEGPASENVSYVGENVTVRANSASDGNYSDYAGSGVNNIFFGKSAYFQINGIALSAEQNGLKLTFGTEKYSSDNGSLFKNEEFHVYLSGDGQKWTEIEYTFAGEAEGRWNVATANFTLKEVPAALSIKSAADVASSYRLDDVKLYTGNGGQEVDLATGANSGGGNEGGETPAPEDAVKATVAEFLAAAEDSTVYQLTGEITRVVNTTYGNFDITDATGTVYIYGLLTPSGESQKQWAAAGLKQGDTITVYGTRSSYNDEPQMKDAVYVSHVAGEGGNEPETPVTPAEGQYASDVAFVCSSDDSANAVYSLGATAIGGDAVTGFKLGTSKKAGVFTSQSVGVSGDKYLSFYAVAWKDKKATLYFKVDDGAVQSQVLAANDGASNVAPYNNLVFADSDYYTIKLTGLTASSKITFSTSANFDNAESADARAIVCGVKLTDEQGGSDEDNTDEGGNDEGNTDEGGSDEGNTDEGGSDEGNTDEGGSDEGNTDEGGSDEGNTDEGGSDEGNTDEGGSDDATTLTIANVLALGQGATINGTIEGIVISNRSLENLTSKKGMYVQDATGALQLRLVADHEFEFGTKVQIDLTGCTLGNYGGAVQVEGIALDKITTVSTGNSVAAKTVSMADFLANKYEGQYIALEGVQVAKGDLARTWVEGSSHTSINMEDAQGNKFVVFSSKYSKYGSQSVAQGSGTIKGISSINKDAMQLIFAQESDFAGLTGERFGDAGNEDNTDDGSSDDSGNDEGGNDQPSVDGAKSVVFDVAACSFNNAQDLTSYTVEPITFAFSTGDNKQGNGPKYYDTGTAVRCYPCNTITISGKTIKSVEVVVDNANAALPLYDGNTKLNGYTWSGSKDNVVLTFDPNVTKGHTRFTSIKVTYVE
ncbi:MAG: hypothetical protein J6R81_04245 [Alistipes sp.]|nr:hypothetical protein [Alistipes sp.]